VCARRLQSPCSSLPRPLSHLHAAMTQSLPQFSEGSTAVQRPVLINSWHMHTISLTEKYFTKWNIPKQRRLAHVFYFNDGKTEAVRCKSTSQGQKNEILILKFTLGPPWQSSGLKSPPFNSGGASSPHLWGAKVLHDLWQK